MFRWSPVLLVIFFCTHCIGAEDGACTERTVVVGASDSNGKAIPFSPQSTDIQGKVNGKPIQILGVTKPTNAERVIIVLDASGSMAGTWQRIIEFAAEIVRESASSTEFALVLFADNELRAVEFGRTGPEMVNEIMSFRGVNPYGRTGLRDAIWKAVSMFQRSHEGDTIVVVSGGRDNQSKVSMRRLREAMWSGGIRVIFAQIVDHYLADEIELGDNADLVWLPESSGGFLYRVENPNTLFETAQEIAFEIENYVAVRMTLPMPFDKQASLHLEAVDSSGRKRKNMDLRFPEMLPPCASLASRQ